MNFIESNFLRKSLLLVFLIHLVIVDVVFNDYVLCIENNGRIALENFEDQQLCCGSVVSDHANKFALKGHFIKNKESCKDIFLFEQCDENKSLIPGRIIPPVVTIIFTFNIHNEYTDLNKLDVQYILLASSFPDQLDSYTTVCLLI